MRTLGVDLGERRIGLAVSDSAGRVALPRCVLARHGERTGGHEAIAALVEGEGIGLAVVGLPRSLDGGLGPQARSVLAEVEVLRSRLAIPVELEDERFSSAVASRRVHPPAGGARRHTVARPRRPNGSGRPDTGLDARAAAVILQAWLDRSHRGP